MKQILIKNGKVVVEEVPAPVITENSILIEVYYSLISSGTELTGITESKEPLIKKVLRDPEKIKKALELAKTEGLSKTIATVKNKLGTSTLSSLGYSCAGKIIEIGKNIHDLKVGDYVACAGTGYANHAEIISAPRNLVVKVPDNVYLKEAASTTLGAIAVQGIRRAEVRFGEIVGVIGLGLLGQLTLQILKATGCRVVGMDLLSQRVELGNRMGMDYGIVIGKEDPISGILQFTSGLGVDATIITAATKSSKPLHLAMEITRKKGKIVIVGNIGLNLKRSPFYEKEIDLLISCSYGPGRYDPNYEEKGKDYPYAYVRWTENRNMQEYLRLLATKKIDFKSLISSEYSIEHASEAYSQLNKNRDRPLAVLLSYISDKELTKKAERKIVITSKAIKREGIINIAVIGLGIFAKEIHLHNLKKLSNIYNIYAVVSKTGNKVKAIAKEFNVSYGSTDYREVLADKNVDAVIIATRHNLHAQMAIEAAKAGKAIFVEKPMALNQEELKELVQVLEETKVPFLVGFNRRFSPYAQKIKEVLQNRLNPFIINYRMNAGYIPFDHWVHTEEGGGRNIGEACHIYDLFSFFTESEVESISAFAIDPKIEQYVRNDNFIATIKYKNGSVCNLIYTSLGAKEVSKEQMDIYVDGKVIHLDDYRKMDIFGAKIKGIKTKIQQKGNYEELLEFAKSIREGNGYPIPLWQLIQATEISFEVEKML